MMRDFWRQALNIFKESMRSLFRGRVPLAALLIGTPLVFTLIFGGIYLYNVVNDIPLVVYDECQSKLSREVVNAYEDSDRFAFVSEVGSEEEMRGELLSGRALAALEVPKKFSEDVLAGRGGTALLLVNSANNMFGNAAVAASTEIARSLSVAAGAQVLEAGGLLPGAALVSTYPVRLGVRILGNPTNGYGPFMLAGLMLNGLQIGLMAAFAPFFVGELLAPRFGRARAGAIALAGAAPYVLVSFLGYLLSLGVITALFAVPIRGSLLAVAGLGLSFLVFVAGVLLLFSACVPSCELALQAPMLYIMPGVLYSGLSWPTFDMNGFAAAFGALLPMTYVADALRDVMLMGYAPALRENIAIMLLAGLGTGAAAACVFSWRRGGGLGRLARRLARKKAAA